MSTNKEKKNLVYSLPSIQIYTFALTTLTRPYTDRYYFTISWASSTSPDIQEQAMTYIPSGWVVRTGKAAHWRAGHWHWTIWGHHHTLLAPYKISSLLIHCHSCYFTSWHIEMGLWSRGGLAMEAITQVTHECETCCNWESRASEISLK